MSLLDNASLVLTPNAYKEGKLYSVIPSDGNGDFTATRATTATRVNADGLVDLVPYNLIQRSEEFDNGVWTKQTASITPNAAVAPDGTTTADLVTPSASDSFVRQIFTAPSGQYTFSVWLKSATGSSFSTEINIGNAIRSTIIVTNDWQRFTTTQPLTTVFSVVIGGFNSLSTGENLYVWGAQAVEGTSARDYLRTETRLNIPRVDYSLGGCPNILLEPQRTNLIQRSSEFDSATWVKLNATVTANAATSPSGVQDADRIQITNATSNYLDNASASPLTNGATYTVSVYARSFGATNQSFRIYGNGNKISPTFTATPTWQRFEYTFTATSTTVSCGIGSPSISDIVVWGYQLEAGAYATSFIPTTTASVTRNADQITRNDIYTNGLITAAGGTWFVELRGNRNLVRDGFAEGLWLRTAVGQDAFRIRNTVSTSVFLVVEKSVAGASANLYTILASTAKVAIKWNGSTADVFVNGVKVVTSTTFTATNMELLNGNGADVPKYINEMALFPTPLTDDQLIELTTL